MRETLLAENSRNVCRKTRDSFYFITKLVLSYRVVFSELRKKFPTQSNSYKTYCLFLSFE